MSRSGTDVAIYQVDAFADEPFAGNPAGVVLDASGLSDDAMRRIAREMNLSETAFLLPAGRSDADLRIRWFTPAVEVDLCGHATVATFHAGMESGRLEAGRYRMECLSGVLPVELSRGQDGRPRVSMGLPVVSLEEVAPPDDLEAALGIAHTVLAGDLPIMKAGDWLVIPFRRRKDLEALAPDFAAVHRWKRHGVGAVIVMTTETIETGSAVHLRMFAPSYGIDEDPVTGSAQGPLAVYMHSCGLLRQGESAYVAEQGDAIGRPGRVVVDVRRGESVEAITISGRAVTVIEGTIHLRV